MSVALEGLLPEVEHLIRWVTRLKDELLKQCCGGAVVAMKGEKCVAIASDRRYGEGSVTIADDADKIFSFGDHLYLGITGLPADTRTVFKTLRFRTNIYEIKENRKISPKVFTNIVTNVLYEKRFSHYYAWPVIAGLKKGAWEPFVCTTDVIGCQNLGEGFVVSGTCKRQLFGSCEMMWKPNLPPDDLFEIISQALMNSCDRDALSGWGATVYVVEKDKVTIRTLKTRMD